MLAQLDHRNDAVSRVRDDSSLIDAALSRSTELIVVGRLSRSDAGVGLSWTLTDDGEEVTVEHPYGSDEAWVHTLYVTVDVDEVIVGEASSKQIAVGLVIDQPVDPADASVELQELGDVVLYLVDSPMFDRDEGVYGVLEDGAFIGQGSPDGRVTFPLLAGEDGLDDEVTIAQLRSAAD